MTPTGKTVCSAADGSRRRHERLARRQIVRAAGENDLLDSGSLTLSA